MLRRAPTTITLTSADVDQYEHNRQRKHWERQQQQEQTSSQSGASQSTEGSESGQAKDQNEDLKQAARDKMKRDRIMDVDEFLRELEEELGEDLDDM